MDKRMEMQELRNALRLFVAMNGQGMSDKQALSVSSLHDKWEAGTEFKTEDVNKVVKHNGKLYRIVSAHTAQAHYPPDGEGVLALYRPIDVEHTGTLEDPIPFVYGMDVTAGLHYYHEGNIWKAKITMAPCVWNPAAGNEWELVA